MPQSSGTATPSENNATGSQQAVQTETSEEEDLFDREKVMRFINDAGLLSYNVRALRINMAAVIIIVQHVRFM